MLAQKDAATDERFKLSMVMKPRVGVFEVKKITL